jgi:transcriptional regulator with XRE-family HTH domain
MPKAETCLRVARRVTHGSIADAAREIGVSFSGLRRAEIGRRVSPETTERIERTFEASLAQLQQPFLREIHE